MTILNDSHFQTEKRKRYSLFAFSGIISWLVPSMEQELLIDHGALHMCFKNSVKSWNMPFAWIAAEDTLHS